MTNKDMINMFLLGGRCWYQGCYWNVVEFDHHSDTFTLQKQNSKEQRLGIYASQCRKEHKVDETKA